MNRSKSLLKNLVLLMVALSAASSVDAFAANAWCSAGFYNGQGPFVMLTVNVGSNEPSQRCTATCTVMFQGGGQATYSLQGTSYSGATNHVVSWRGLASQPTNVGGNAACYRQ